MKILDKEPQYSHAWLSQFLWEQADDWSSKRETYDKDETILRHICQVKADAFADLAQEVEGWDD